MAAPHTHRHSAAQALSNAAPVLIVAHPATLPDGVAAAVGDRAERGDGPFHVLVALQLAAGHGNGHEIDEADAQQWLAEALRRLSANANTAVTGEVADGDPIRAVDHASRLTRYGEVTVVLPPGAGGPQRALLNAIRELGLPAAEIAAAGDPPLRVSRLSKSFPGLRALDDVALTVAAGEIVSVVGQNGSGKSTLVKILAGLHAPDPGAVIEHRELRFIHQDLGLVETLSTVENLDLGRAHGRRSLLPAPRRKERLLADSAIKRFGGDFDVLRPVGELAAAERTIVAIARAMSDWSPPEGVLVLDEPTASLGRGEVDRLFDAIRRVAQFGAGVVFISHRLDEVLGLSDRVVALRDGRVVADVPASEVDHADLVEIITGRAIAEVKIAHHDSDGPVVLRARDLHASRLRGVSFDLRRGEILGVTGLLGSGRDDLLATIFGASNRDAGEVVVDGERLVPGNPTASIGAGLAFVPADRLHHGGVMTHSAAENLALPQFALTSPVRALAPLDLAADRREAHKWIKRIQLHPRSPDRPLQLFSGGNQQKVVIAKWLRTTPRVLLLEEPTQGVDVGAKAAIYELIDQVSASGTAVLLSSSDVRELITLCDRVLVFRDGHPTAELPRQELSEARLVNESFGLPGKSDVQPVFD